MSATIIDGSAVAARLRAETAQDVEKMVAEHGVRPGLATVLIGDNPASQSYVRMKQKACAEVGIQSFGYDLPATTSQQEAEALVRELNANPAIHGILVQLPCQIISKKSRFSTRSVLKRTWTVSTRSTSAGWR